MHNSTQSIPAIFLKSTALPSMSGLLADAPILPTPEADALFEMHATIFPLFV